LRSFSPLVAAAFVCAVLALGALVQSARAQNGEVQRLDAARAGLERIEKTLERKDLTDAALQALRADSEPIAADIVELLREIEPRREASRLRLEQLGKAPEAKPANAKADSKPAESKPADAQNPVDKAQTSTEPTAEAAHAAAAAEFAEQQKAFNDYDGLFKRARLLSVQSEQVVASISNRRRALFRQALFQHAASVLSPSLWINAISDLPRDASALGVLASDWAGAVTNRLRGATLVSFLAAIAAIGFMFALARWLARRILDRAPTMRAPTALQKAGAALWTTMVVATIPIATALALIELARLYGLFSPGLEPLVSAIFDAVRRIAIAIALSRGLLSIAHPDWRLLDLSTPACERVRRLVVAIAIIVSAMKIADALVDLTAASVAVAVLLRGLGSVAVAAIMAFALYGFGAQEMAAADPCDELGPRVEPRRDWWALWRNVSWAAIVAILGASLVGFIAFGSFIVDQLVWTTFVIAGGYLFHKLADNFFSAALAPETAASRAARNSIGLSQDSLRQLAILLRGATSLFLVMIGTMLILAPWGVESDDMIGNLRAAFFGFKVGDVTISLSAFLIALAVFAAAVAGTRVLQGWLEKEYLPTTQLDVGLRNSIRTSVGYVGFVLALSVALAQVGMSFEKLAIVAGALSIGVGFGLQSIVNNFVSGLILLWERAIRVGDWVVVGDEQGYVRRINVRSTEIETFDRATMIVPNSNLVTGVVKNWVRADRVGRIKVPVAVAVAADPDQVRALLLECAKDQELILETPVPQVMFSAMAESTLRFELICFISDVEKSQRVRSDLNFAIFRSFRDADIDISPPAAAPVVVKIGH
jgi:small-conductance mechanosensitive channel